MGEIERTYAGEASSRVLRERRVRASRNKEMLDETIKVSFITN